MHQRHRVSCPLKIHEGGGEVENSCLNFSEGGMLIAGSSPPQHQEFFASLFVPNTHISYTFRLKTTFHNADSFGAQIIDGPRDFFKTAQFWRE